MSLTLAVFHYTTSPAIRNAFANTRQSRNRALPILASALITIRLGSKIKLCKAVFQIMLYMLLWSGSYLHRLLALIMSTASTHTLP